MRETEKEYYHGQRRVAREETASLWAKVAFYLVIFFTGSFTGFYYAELSGRKDMPLSMHSMAEFHPPGTTERVSVLWNRRGGQAECQYHYKPDKGDWRAAPCTGAFAVEWGDK